MTMTLGAAIFVTMFVSKATAGCGDLRNWQGPFEFVQQSADAHMLPHAIEAESQSERGWMGASIVGM
jgi:hypothetical protein